MPGESGTGSGCAGQLLPGTLEEKVHGSTTDAIYAWSAFACALLGAASDLGTRRIPNWLTGSSLIAGLGLHLALGGWRSLLGASAAGLIAGLIFLAFYLAGGMGAGDVKLITAVCCLAGAGRVAGVLVATALLGGVLAVAVALWHRRLKRTFSNVASLLRHHGRSGLEPHHQLSLTNPDTLRLPYGVAIAAGAGSSLCGVLLR